MTWLQPQLNMKIPTNKLLFPALWDISQRSYSFFPVFFRLSHATIVLRLSILVFLTTLSSCISTKKLTYLQESQSAQDRLIQVNLQQPPYHVQINDVLSIRVKALDQELVALFNPQTAGAEGNSLGEGYYYDGFAVDRHGAIRLPTLGEIHVLGYTTEEIRELIEKKLLDDYFTEEANIFVTVKLAGIKYTIGGEIGGPGVKVDLVEQLSLLDAIVNSGDITEYGDRTDVLIIRQYPGGKKIHHIDLTKIEALNSPYYYVQPNDVILVNPLPQKSLGIGTTGLQSLTTVVSILTLATTTILLFSRL
ncbi:protein involved in gliding motility EpsA [Leeuwenhoekiella marinoflava DSM 3653]|uniref:Protein involved in gliding motility EpsA n=3 Tax=Leeuwenhoekiella marinoflava TaxID=988 RepID=A0A4Q0PKA2_9FLAO|nr:protein involved in gliding motility EpsA [Leeuwenhoekiella marinoflava]SHF40804.1 protein involved in gliding motility EpsA [Leeuwenhoekiella marinoflava DSM 3653]